jgi:hypothetical protein
MELYLYAPVRLYHTVRLTCTCGACSLCSEAKTILSPEYVTLTCPLIVLGASCTAEMRVRALLACTSKLKTTLERKCSILWYTVTTAFFEVNLTYIQIRVFNPLKPGGYYTYHLL